MNASHTPGPWFIRKTKNTSLTDAHWYELVAYTDSDQVVLGELFESDVGAEATAANAPLIAAAPDMLMALYQYVSDLRYPPEGDSVERRIAAAEAIIAKATGQ